MSSSQYTLYELVAHADDRESQSTHSFFVLRTKLDLALLGLKYTRVPLAFGDIEGTLGAGVTLPTLATGTGRVVDSFSIAEYLEGQHATGGKYLFGPGGSRLARFIQSWADGALLPAMMPLLAPLFVAHNDAASRAYFVTRIWPADEVERMSAELRDAERVRENAAAVRKVLRVLEVYLAHSSGRFILGDTPTHADSIVGGYYFASQVNPALNALVWDHAELPRVARWVKDFKEASGFEVAYPPPPAGVVADV
ncbi:hypothetical protein Q8F55_002502 [Vanrija albida]|uniref:Glutathione S-transferase UstS-like C-terminal domain-containing protein n=1 Tax=Vanrija albida TaxID=181172 RepID=A0ABR3Q9Z4_9TREE